MILVIIILAFFAASVEAQTLPERFMVSGVAADDVLNIRQDPNAASPIVGELQPDAASVEIQFQDDGWGYTIGDERSGWVSMAYLAPNPVPEGTLPRPLACFGTEPFWTLTFNETGADYSSLADGDADLTVLSESVAANGYTVQAAQADYMTRTLIISALPCSDGMSDRTYGMTTLMFTQSLQGNTVDRGCCSLQVN